MKMNQKRGVCNDARYKRRRYESGIILPRSFPLTPTSQRPAIVAQGSQVRIHQGTQLAGQKYTRNRYPKQVSETVIKVSHFLNLL